MNTTPLQPQLTESELIFLNGLGPSVPSFNEFNPLFQRNRFGLLASGLIAGNGTSGDEVVQSGNWGRFSYSLGQLHYESRGSRANNDYRLDSQIAFGQFQVTPDLSLQAEYKHRESVSGDMNQWYNGYFDEYFRSSWEFLSYRAGMRYQLTGRDSFIASLIHTDLTRRPTQLPCFDCVKTAVAAAESQIIHRARNVNLTVGGGYYERGGDGGFRHENVYGYLNAKLLPNTTWVFGVSRNYLESDLNGSFDFVNPKGGVIWELTPNTVVRLAAFRTTPRDLVNSQTIEPTQVAGFNQMLDGYWATSASTYAAALDQKFSRTLFAGVEASLRAYRTPTSIDGITRYEPRFSEQLYRGYVNYAFHEYLTLSLDFYAEVFHVPEGSPVASIFQPSETLFVPLKLSGFLPNGGFAKAQLGYFSQTVDDGERQASDGFILDLAAGYRLPGRMGIFEAGLRNALDTRIPLQGFQPRTPPDLFSAPKNLPISPELNWYMKLTIALF